MVGQGDPDQLGELPAAARRATILARCTGAGSLELEGPPGRFESVPCDGAVHAAATEVGNLTALRRRVVEKRALPPPFQVLVVVPS
ncbi:MAG TPA: hypothetical protein VF109_09420 [Mycobacteriales bacterium]